MTIAASGVKVLIFVLFVSAIAFLVFIQVVAVS
jgi:hypothetical protein